MTDQADKKDPVKRPRSNGSSSAPKQPTARRSVKGSASSGKDAKSKATSAAKPSQDSKLRPKQESVQSSVANSSSMPSGSDKGSRGARASRPFKGTGSSRGGRTSKIPRTTTASKVGKTGARPSEPGHRYVAKTSYATSPRVDVRRASISSASGDAARKAASSNAKSPRLSSGAPAQKDSKAQSVRTRDRYTPQTRTPSASNEFVEFTKSHLAFMIPVFIVLVLLVGYTFVDIVASFGKIHPGVAVQGVQVGGLTVEEASEKLTDELTPVLTNAHVAAYGSEEMAEADGVHFDDSTIEKAYADETAGTDLSGNGAIDKWNITADTIGAYIDGESLANEAYLVGRKGNFVAERFFSWFGGTELPAIVSVREERFNTLKAEIDKEVGHPIVNSTVRIENGTVTAVDGTDGSSVNTSEFIDLFSQSAFNDEMPAFIIPMQVETMLIKPETASRVAEDVRKAIKDDVTIVHDPDTWVMDSTDLGNVIGLQVLAPNEMMVFEAGSQKVIEKSDDEDIPDYDTSAWADADSGYVLQAFVDQTKLDSFLVGILGPLATGGAQDAYFDTSSGEVVLVESVQGFGPDRSAAEIAMQDLLFGEPSAKDAANRTITLVDSTIEPAVTTEKAQAMGITERLATWTIPLSGTSQRIANIRLLCNLINNSLVAPGATWSFNGTTGERTAEKGFQTAPVIINGKHEDQLGGGICQIATCIFNAACFSGLGIEERVNHDFYIASYDDYGFCDATVSWKSPDLKWKNDMSTYVLMTAQVTDSDVVVTFWGTKDGRTVACERGEWRPGDGYVSITEVDPEMAPGTSRVAQSGQDGRAIDVKYYVTAADGTVLHDVTFHSIYSAQNEIINVGPSAPEPAAPAAAPEATGTQ